MSRVPVREALIELAQESLIDAVPRRGAFVARLERADIVDHYRIFGLIAGLAGSRAATSLTDEQLVAAAPDPRVVRRRRRPRGPGVLEPRVPQDDQPGRRVPPVGLGARGSCRAACRCATSSSCPQWAEIVGAAPRPDPERAGSSTTLTRRSESWSTTSPRAVTLAVEILQEMGYWDRDPGRPVGQANPARPSQVAPLDGIRVLELCHFLAGPYTGLVLADLGADVLKVEDPTHPDDARSMGPHFQGGQSLYFLALNSGKRSIGVRLATAEGRAVVEDLVRGADVVIDNYRPGVLAKFGLGHDALHAVNPAHRHVFAHRLRRDRARRCRAPGTTTPSRHWPA